MSPEQVRGEPADHRSDIFSFGTIAYEMVSGKRPFHGQTSIETLSAILNAEPGELSLAEEPGSNASYGAASRRTRTNGSRPRATSCSISKGCAERAAFPAPAARGRGRRAARPDPGLRCAGDGRGLGGFALDGTLATRRANWKLTRLTSDSRSCHGPRRSSADGKPPGLCPRIREARGISTSGFRQVGGGNPLRLTRTRPTTASRTSRLTVVASPSDPSARAAGYYVVPALGGEERRIADGAGDLGSRRTASGWRFWTGETGSDSPAHRGSKTYVIAVNGGTPRQIRPDFAATRYPVWSPDGKSLLVPACGTGKGRGRA
jgi:hypothetical protein